ITQEDTAATVIGSILAVIAVTVGLGAALLALKVALDVPALRIVCFAAFFCGGLFLKRVLTIGALGSAIGLPAALAMMLPDITPPSPEVVVDFVLWLWWCVTLGLSVNVGVQLLLSPGDPLALLRRELDLRLHALEQTLRRAAGHATAEPPAPLGSLAVAGMSRPLALLRTATVLPPSARPRHEVLSAVITLVDRLVTAAQALAALRPFPADSVDRTRCSRAAGRRAPKRQDLGGARAAAAGGAQAPPP